MHAGLHTALQAPSVCKSTTLLRLAGFLAFANHSGFLAAVEEVGATWQDNSETMYSNRLVAGLVACNLLLAQQGSLTRVVLARI